MPLRPHKSKSGVKTEDKSEMNSNTTSACEDENEINTNVTSSSNDRTVALTSNQSPTGPTTAQVFNDDLKSSISGDNDVVRVAVVGAKMKQCLLVKKGEHVPHSPFGTEHLKCSISATTMAQDVRLRYNDTAKEKLGVPTGVALHTENGTRFHTEVEAGEQAYGEINVRRDEEYYWYHRWWNMAPKGCEIL